TAELNSCILCGGHRERARLVPGRNFLIAVDEHLRAGIGVKDGLRLRAVDGRKPHLDALDTVAALLTRPVAAQVKNHIPWSVRYRAFLHAPSAHIDLCRSTPANELRPATEVDLDIVNVDT